MPALHPRWLSGFTKTEKHTQKKNTEVTLRGAKPQNLATLDQNEAFNHFSITKKVEAANPLSLPNYAIDERWHYNKYYWLSFSVLCETATAGWKVYSCILTTIWLNKFLVCVYVCVTRKQYLESQPIRNEGENNISNIIFFSPHARSRSCKSV